MSTLDVIAALALSLVGIALSALYSGLETGTYTMNRVRLTVLAARRKPAAMRLRREYRDPGRTLIVLLIATNAANYLGSYGLAELLHGFGLEDWTLIVMEALIVTPLLLVFAETLPKDLFRTFADRWMYWLSPVIVGTRWVLTATVLLPVVQLVTLAMGRWLGSTARGTVTARQRVSQLIKEGVGAGVLTESQTSLADRALALRDRKVSDVMVPWHDVIRLPVAADRAGREALLRRRNFSRVPVIDADGRVVGVLSWVDAALEPDRPTADLAGEVLTMNPATTLRGAMMRLRRERHSMAIVVPPEGDRPLGLVTLKDLVEPLTGKLSAW